MSEQAAREIFKQHHLRHPGHMEYCALCESDVAAALKDAERARDAFDEELATRTAQWEAAEARADAAEASDAIHAEAASKAERERDAWLVLCAKVPSLVRAAEAQLARVREAWPAMRCEVTGNLVGTDTWSAGCYCPCQVCRLWLVYEGAALAEPAAGEGMTP